MVWKNIHFIMWDLGGQETLRAAWNTYYSNTEVSMRSKVDLVETYSDAHFVQFVILVVDSTDRERLSISRDELHKMLGHEELSKANILVFANKQVRGGFLRQRECCTKYYSGSRL